MDKSGDFRTEAFQRIEKEIRDSLISISTCEELNTLYNLLAKIKYFVELNTKQNTEILTKKIEEITSKGKISSEELNNYYLNKFCKNDTELRKKGLILFVN